MRDTKYRFETLCIYDYRGVEEHLSTLAARGWRLEKAGRSFWKYRRAEPGRKVRYAVTYSADASQFAPGPTEGQKSLAELCEAAGWSKVCGWGQMQIFSTEDENAVPLETDEALRLENIHRSMRKSFLPANIGLLVVGLLLSALFLYTLFTNPFRIFESDSNLFTGIMFLLLSLLESYTLCHYYLWRRRSRRSIEDDGPCAPIDTKRYQRLNRRALALLYILCVLYLLTLVFRAGRYAVFFLVYTALLVLLILAVRKTTDLLRNRGVSKRWNIAGTLAADVVLTIALVIGMSWAVLHLGVSSQRTYEYRGNEWDAEPVQGAPLTLADLTGRDLAHVRRLYYETGSIFLPHEMYRETALFEDGSVRRELLHLDYEVWSPKFDWLQEALLEDALKDAELYISELPAFHKSQCYEPEDPSSWGAEASWRKYWDGTALNTWYLVWPGRVVCISLKEPPTEAEKAAVLAYLGPEA